ncbi:MAG: type II CAAX endopeptidase family protein [Rikenellaceae bacterium]
MSSTLDNQPQEPIETLDNGGKKRRIFPSFIDLAAIFGVYIVAQIIAVLAIKIAIPHLLPHGDEATQMAWLMLASQIISMVLTIIFIYVIRHVRQAEAITIRLSLKGLDPTLLLGGLLMLLSASVVIEPLLTLLPPTPPIVGRGWPMLVAVIIGAPLFEEFICRGLILESMRTKSGVLMAWFFSSLFFGLMHLDPTMVINAFVMGLILGYIYIRSESLWAAIILHALNNAIAYMLILLGLGDNFILREAIASDVIYYAIYALAAIILLVSILLCRERFKLMIKPCEEESMAPKVDEQPTIEEE